MNYVSDVKELIGNTPLIKLTHINVKKMLIYLLNLNVLILVEV